MTRHIEIVRAGPLTTVQDLGRFGHRSSGVSPSGAADLASMALANALAGNPASAAVLEATFGHLTLRARDALMLVVTGAGCPGVRMDTPLALAAGESVALGAAGTGVRAYVAVRGGIAVEPVLGSRSTDTLSGLGPAPLRDGDLVPIGDAEPVSDEPPPHHGPPGHWSGELTLVRGPRDERLPEHAWASIRDRAWTVSPQSNRVAVRLSGPALPISTDPLPPEPLVRGAVQVPPDGQPIIFLADHPVTGGYPVIGVLTPAACDAVAQCRPGTSVRLGAVS